MVWSSYRVLGEAETHTGGYAVRDTWVIREHGYARGSGVPFFLGFPRRMPTEKRARFGNALPNVLENWR